MCSKLKITPRVMKIMGFIILSLDMVLLLLWVSGLWYNASQVGTDPCFSAVFVVHFLIVCHFILLSAILAMLDIIMKEEQKAASEEKVLKKLPYIYYTPTTWIVTSIIALLGDVSLLAFSANENHNIGGDDKCQQSRIFHIAFDGLAILVCLIAIVWFLVLSFYTIEESPVDKANRKKRKGKEYESHYNK
jgi:hypothetical protein